MSESKWAVFFITIILIFTSDAYFFQNVIFFDGHYSYATSNLQLLEMCLEHNKVSEKQVQLVCLPSGQTDKLQPLDYCSSLNVKDKFRRYKDYYRVMDSDFEVIFLN